MLPVWAAGTYSLSLQGSVDPCGGEHASPSSAFKRLGPMVTGATMGEQKDPPLQENETDDGEEGTPLVGPRNLGGRWKSME